MIFIGDGDGGGGARERIEASPGAVQPGCGQLPQLEEARLNMSGNTQASFFFSPPN